MSNYNLSNYNSYDEPITNTDKYSTQENVQKYDLIEVEFNSGNLYLSSAEGLCYVEYINKDGVRIINIETRLYRIITKLDLTNIKFISRDVNLTNPEYLL